MSAKALIDKLHFGWSKWGGARREFIVEELEEWTCQACAVPNSIEVPSFMTELFDNEYVKICSKCQNLKQKEHIGDFHILISRVRVLG